MKKSIFKRHFLFLAAVLCLAGSLGYAAFAKCLSAPGTSDMTLVFVAPANECKASIDSSNHISPHDAALAHPPSDAEIKAVEAWLKAEGLAFEPLHLPADPHVCRQSIRFTGTNVQMAHAFPQNASSHYFQLPEQFKNIIGYVVMQECDKPAIYLYPPHDMRVKIRLKFDGEVSVTYPEYHNGWDVTAHPDGKLVNREDGEEYAYLFWEGNFRKNTMAFADGFVVKAEDSANFLREKLALLGLAPKEYNEFIVYWLPQLLKSPYNLIHFSGEDYRNMAQLEVTPKPDSEIRVFMVFRPLLSPVEFPKQNLMPAKRTGFAVVEWGGTQMP